MASLYRPKIVEYRLRDGSYRTPDGKRVRRDTPGAIKSTRPSKKWYGRYTDGSGRPMRVPLSESKETARRMLAKIAGDAQLAGVGIADPFAKHRYRPLTEHIDDFRRYLAAEGDTAVYCRKATAHVRAICEGCRFTYIDDLQPSAVVEFLARLRKPRACPSLDPEKEWYTAAEMAEVLGVIAETVRNRIRAGLLPGPAPQPRPWRIHRESLAALMERGNRGIGIATSNDYLGSIKRFSKWLVKDGRAVADPLSHLSRLNRELDVRHPRRALQEDLFNRFIEATVSGPAFRGLGGAARLVLYTLAAHTGFRARELASLTPASFDLLTDPPTVTVEATISKRRRRDVQPLRVDVAEFMRQFIADRPKNGRLWPGSWWRAGAEMIRRDLIRAGIPYQDDSGRYFDFHATRGQFISLLAARGVHPKVAQILARHSSINLTMDYYTHLDVLDVTGALDKLPGLGDGKQAPEADRRERRA
jgi:excisionase family DNA binding protein